ncbi:MAG: FtsX-like permease family protein [Thermoplasmata archaeon]
MALLDGTAAGLLLLLAVVAIISLVLALRHRLAFRIAMRNVRRGRSRTVLLILGLLIGTTIISGSLIVGDTVNQLNVHFTYIADGFNDEAIYNQSPIGAHVYFPYSVFTDLSNASAGNPNIAGITPMIIGTTQIFDRSTQIPETNLNLIGVNGNQSAQLGNFVTDAGESLSGPAPGSVLLDDLAASSMNASAGNQLVVYGSGAVPIPLTVQAVVQDNLRGGVLTGGLGASGNVFVTLATAQALENASGTINWISVTNSGSQVQGATLSSKVSAQLNASLAQIPAAKGLKVHILLQEDVASAETAGSSLTTLFLVLGLFSIVAGAMLIVGIFVMLAEERKGEMGMLRAIGLRRRDLVHAFYFEGLAYSAGSALAGTILGVGVGYGLTYAFSQLFASPGLTQSAILQSFTVTQDSLITAYVAGFLLTLVTVVVASRRASRLNIVRAIRDLPEPPPTLRAYTYLAYFGIVLTIVGILIFVPTYRGTSDVSYPTIAGALIILGLALIASRFARNRLVFSLAGAAFVVWAGVEPLRQLVLGTSHTGGIFIVFVEGILMVVGALLLYTFNSTTIVAAIARVFGRDPRRHAVVRVGLSYPARQPARTTINLAIFALVIFTLVAIASFGSTLQASLNTTVENQSGGYSFVGFSTTPIPDLYGHIQNNTTLAPMYSAAVPLISGGIQVNVSGFSGDPYGDNVYAAPVVAPGPSNFYTTNHFPFSATWKGMSASQVMTELETNGSAAIVDNSYAPVTTSVTSTSSGPPHPSVTPGETISVQDPATGNTTHVVIFGILLESFVTGIWLDPTTAAGLGYHQQDVYFLTTSPGVSETRAQQAATSAFYPYGLFLLSFQAVLSSSLASTIGIIGLLQIFVGLGLGVGIAGMGIVALRAVVERRREIGMLRASGFTRRMTLASFFVEYSFVALLGIGIGTGLGLLIVYDLTHTAAAASEGVSTLAIPWVNLILILIVTYALAMAAVAGPSLRAARLPPADAVRATE